MQQLSESQLNMSATRKKFRKLLQNITKTDTLHDISLINPSQVELILHTCLIEENFNTLYGLNLHTCFEAETNENSFTLIQPK